MHKANHPSRAGSGTHDRTSADPRAVTVRHPVTRAFERFASHVTVWAGSPIAFGSAVALTVLWLVTGPLFHYSDAWQLVINTGTTIITFLMVFLLQRNQNRDSVAMHLKLDELVAVTHAASDRLIGIEDASEEELRAMAQTYLDLAKRVAARDDKQDDGRDRKRADHSRES
ncbi:low affinity iron permease family protein [Burkholderia sp. Se-20378]|uniref:low affinity iron permease family protein n=1 Tax=Burkholderia sp. Se-20378 TaxID=2703899 RepID=UPI00197D9DDF|nr:low affinity iron permease family protein [Burkholderia sp. Se-20378]MBN3768030.1 low affinity iron permease family protein [Burkholderia sp. Se-20378]